MDLNSFDFFFCSYIFLCFLESSIVGFFISLFPVFFNYFGLTYLLSSFFLGSYYVYLCYKLLTSTHNENKLAKKIFVYSILYLFLLFSIILIDKII